MENHLQAASARIETDQAFAGFTVTSQGRELHLVKGDESFVRLIPAEPADQWRFAFFHNEKRWQHIDFTGSLEACLEPLARSPRYLYWE